MKQVLLIVALLTCMVGCNAQTRENKPIAKQDTANEQNKPRVNWKVNKRYDDKGNLIGYDSTYTWLYSGKGGIREVEADSVLLPFANSSILSCLHCFARISVIPYGATVYCTRILLNQITS